MAFALAVELVNMRMRKNQAPVALHHKSKGTHTLTAKAYPHGPMWSEAIS